MRNITLALLAAAVLTSCANVTNTGASDSEYEKLTDRFLKEYLDSRPLVGVGLGLHQYDGQFVVPDKVAIEAQIAQLEKYKASFGGLAEAKLSDTHKHDLGLLQSSIDGELWWLTRQKMYSSNPMAYAGGVGDASSLDVSVYLKRTFAPLAERVQDMTSVLRVAPATLDSARANLDQVLAKPFVETAIEAADGTADFLQNDAAKEVLKVGDSTVRTEFEIANRAAVQSFRAYAKWLKTEKLPNAKEDFALGKELYSEMLKGEMIDLPPEQILEVGMRELKAEQGRFARAAAVIDPARKPEDVYEAMQREHPTAAGLIPDTRKDLAAIRKFVADHHLVTICGELLPRVEETLPPFRSTSFASMDTPGPFEKRAKEAYYYVTPVEADWTPKQAEEWLGSFNYFEIDVTSIHEAYPGHYVQFLALNASPANRIEKVFNSYAFVEGWAHYCEAMMIDQGYGQPANPASATSEQIVRGAKFRLAQSSDALLRICRLCCSIRMHCQGMSLDEATRFFMDNCYYGEKPARSEAMRGTHDPGYLYYTLGKLMILKLREDWKAQEGAAYAIERFHNEFLRHGAPPIPLLRRIMLKNPADWDKCLPDIH